MIVIVKFQPKFRIKSLKALKVRVQLLSKRGTQKEKETQAKKTKHAIHSGMRNKRELTIVDCYGNIVIEEDGGSSGYEAGLESTSDYEADFIKYEERKEYEDENEHRDMDRYYERADYDYDADYEDDNYGEDEGLYGKFGDDWESYHDSIYN